jgi:asparagine synthase (glutamine-hydrolysing)
MPGIAGIISIKSDEENKGKIALMRDSMMHEPFYSDGIYINDDLNIYLSLVCHKDSFSDCMPIWNEKKDIALIFFGENFIDLELFDQLKGKNHKFDKSNSSYLVHLYEEKGQDFFEELNGWFTGVLVDMRAGKVILFNDRYGYQRLYYFAGKDAFYFSSEAKAILKICPELREIDMKSLGEFFCCECVLENRTLFKNIFLLPCSSAWTFQKDIIPQKKSYFRPDAWENQTWLEKEFFYTRLFETFNKILPRYFRAGQSIGMALTGGLDTRMIMANMKMSASKFPCYTFGSLYRDNYDVKIARKVAAVTNHEHKVLTLDKKYLDNFSHYAEKAVYISDGYADVSMSPEIYINRLARDIAPIRMTGNYGSEVLRSVSWLNYSTPNTDMFQHDFIKYLHDAPVTYASLEPNKKHPLSFTLFIEAPWHENIRFLVEQSQLTLRTPYMDNDLVSLMYRAPVELRNNKEISYRLVKDGNQILSQINTDRGFSIGSKSPLSFLRHLYYEFLFKAEYAYNYGMPQWLAMYDYLFKQMHFEKIFLGRHKFNHFRIWYRDELAEYVKEILLDERTTNRPYLNKNYLLKIVQGHTKGNRNYTTEITRMLTLELLQRTLVEQ